MNVIALTFFLKCLVIIPVINAKEMGPHFSFNQRTSCEQFSQFARFNPYTMLNGTWLVFYYWAPPQPTLIFNFTALTKEDYKYLHKRLDNRVTVPVNWTARHVAMWDSKKNMNLLVETGDRGQFRLYYPEVELAPGKKASPVEIRFKQTGDNKVVGFMLCAKDQVFAMSRIRYLPRQKQLQEAASRLNYRNRGGKSYLYAGNSWMPIPEIDERRFWSTTPPHKNVES